MKTLILSLLLLTSASSIFAQTPRCPIDIKSNQGGGRCADLDFGGQSLKGTAVVTLTFSGPVMCAPKLLSVTDHDNVTRMLKSGVGTVQAAPNNDKVEYCLYGEKSDDNFFNQPDLIVQLQYTCEDATSPVEVTPVTIFCDEAGKEVDSPFEEIPLPVTFKSVNAARKTASSVGVTWTTASEQNNRGFYVQRNDGSGWKNVAFVFSQSVAGTSSSDLSYEYNDANTEKGVSQYRIQQVDLDGKASYSIIRAIRGESVGAKVLVYPNPSSNGNINVVFESNNGVRDVVVNDAAGRVVKIFKSITNNNLQIENLKSGFYTLKITNRTTASSSVEKVVVK
jgi:hypothetical protein